MIDIMEALKKMKQYKIIAIFGKSGSGKDTFLNKLYDSSKYKDKLNKIVSYTTRPPREGEVEGEAYHFISSEDFLSKVMNGEMIEATNFVDWFYGTGVKCLDISKVNIGVFNPEGIRSLLEDSLFDVYPVYVDCDDWERMRRIFNRETKGDVAEVVRRYNADETDFKFLDFYYLTAESGKEEDFKEIQNIILELLDDLP